MSLTRRNFIKIAGATGALGLAGCQTTPNGTSPGKVVIIGGGFGGATAAKYLKKFDPAIEVTLIEPQQQYVTCPGSNWVIGGMRSIDSITYSYDTLERKYGIRVIHALATNIDPEARRVDLDNEANVRYDRLIISPGIDFRWDTIDGYNAEIADRIPHAWKAGTQTTTLHEQLKSMRQGGTFLMAAPPNPFRCPPGPYERISLVADYLKKNNPRAKIICLDSKDKHSKFGAFRSGWEKLYGFGTDKSMIEWVPASDGGKVVGLSGNNTLIAGDLEDEHKGDVLNIIPAQKAGAIAAKTGLTDETGWCPVDHLTWESSKIPGIHVIGDSAVQKPLPKSGFAANSEAKVCAASVAALLRGEKPPAPSWVNTCYSLVSPNYGISVAMVYRLGDKGLVEKIKGSGGVTRADADFALEAAYAEGWHTSIADDIFG